MSAHNHIPKRTDGGWGNWVVTGLTVVAVAFAIYWQPKLIPLWFLAGFGLWVDLLSLYWILLGVVGRCSPPSPAPVLGAMTYIICLIFYSVGKTARNSALFPLDTFEWIMIGLLLFHLLVHFYVLIGLYYYIKEKNKSVKYTI